MCKADLLVASTLLVTTLAVGRAQTSAQRNPDVSNKALITKSTPGISTDAFKNQSANTSDVLRKMADDYYAWRNENYPVRSRTPYMGRPVDRLFASENRRARATCAFAPGKGARNEN
jgi:hypothetical protein